MFVFLEIYRTIRFVFVFAVIPFWKDRCVKSERSSVSGWRDYAALVESLLATVSSAGAYSLGCVEGQSAGTHVSSGYLKEEVLLVHRAQLFYGPISPPFLITYLPFHTNVEHGTIFLNGKNAIQRVAFRVGI